METVFEIKKQTLSFFILGFFLILPLYRADADSPHTEVMTNDAQNFKLVNTATFDAAPMLAQAGTVNFFEGLQGARYTEGAYFASIRSEQFSQDVNPGAAARNIEAQRDIMDLKLSISPKESDIHMLEESHKEKDAVLLTTQDDLQSTISFLPYEKTEGGGFRFYYRDIPSDVFGHAWYFPEKDLRGKVVRVHYSGIVPKEVTFKFMRTNVSAAAIFHCYLENTAKRKTLEFIIPATLAFKEVRILKLLVEKANAGNQSADFIVEKIEVLEEESFQAGTTMRDPTHSYDINRSLPAALSRSTAGEMLSL